MRSINGLPTCCTNQTTPQQSLDKAQEELRQGGAKAAFSAASSDAGQAAIRGAATSAWENPN